MKNSRWAFSLGCVWVKDCKADFWLFPDTSKSLIATERKKKKNTGRGWRQIYDMNFLNIKDKTFEEEEEQEQEDC